MGIEFGIDLYEVYNWPIEKKLVYAQHLQAWDEAQEAAHDDPLEEMDMDMDSSQIPNYNGQGTPPNAGSGATGQPFAGRKDIHPSLRQYDSLVNVQNPGAEMSPEEKAKIMEKPEMMADPDEIDRGSVEADRGPSEG